MDPMLITPEKALLGARTRLEERTKELGEVEDTLDIEGEHAFKSRLIVVVHRKAPHVAPALFTRDIEVISAIVATIVG